MKPLVTVLMPIHNAAGYLSRAVKSIQQQTHDRWELLCLDDGSTDSSAEIVRGLARQDSRIHLHSLRRDGIVATLNHGVALAKGDFIARMDADDVSLPHRFRVQLDQLQASRQLAMIGGAFHTIDLAERVLRTQFPPSDPCEVRRLLARGNCLCHSSVMIRHEVLSQFPGPYRPQFLLAEDFDLWLRVAERFEIGNVPDVVLCYRRDLSNLQSDRLARQSVSALAAILAAESRSAGGGDPAEHWQDADRETLLRAGVSPNRIARVVRRTLLSEARIAKKYGYVRSCQSLLREAAAIGPHGEGIAARLDYAWRLLRVRLG